jgi:hypothetical protein
MKERSGYDWIETKSGGYWSKTNNKARHSHTTPMFCPYEDCRRITGTIDDKYMLEYGICAKCYVLYVEDRQVPLIDTEAMKNRLKERGY